MSFENLHGKPSSRNKTSRQQSTRAATDTLHYGEDPFWVGFEEARRLDGDGAPTRYHSWVKAMLCPVTSKRVPRREQGLDG